MCHLKSWFVCFKFITPSAFLCVDRLFHFWSSRLLFSFVYYILTGLGTMATFVRWATAIWIAYGSEPTSKVLYSAWTCSSEWGVDYRETQQQKINQDIASWPAEWFWILTVITLERMSIGFHKDTYPPTFPSPTPAPWVEKVWASAQEGEPVGCPGRCLNEWQQKPRRTPQWACSPGGKHREP